MMCRLCRLRVLSSTSAVASVTRTPVRGSAVLARIVGVIWFNRIELLLRAPKAETNGSRRDVCGPSVVLKRLWSTHM